MKIYFFILNCPGLKCGAIENNPQEKFYFYPAMISNMNILVSSPEMDDPIFHRAVLLITQENASGATGFIINKKHPRRLNDLVEFHHCKSWPLHFGGPAEDEKLFFIHRRPDLIEDGEPLGNNIFLGGDFRQAIEFINNDTLRENDIMLFVGYCGWDAGELEAEIKDGYWKKDNSQPDIFT